MALAQICMSAHSCIELHLNAENGTLEGGVSGECGRKGLVGFGKPRKCGHSWTAERDRTGSPAVRDRERERERALIGPSPKYVMKIRKQDILSLRNGRMASVATVVGATIKQPQQQQQQQ